MVKFQKFKNWVTAEDLLYSPLSVVYILKEQTQAITENEYQSW